MHAFLLLVFVIAEIILIGSGYVMKLKKKTYIRNRFLLNLTELAGFGLLLPFGVVNFGIRFNALFGILLIRMLYAGICFVTARHKISGEKTMKMGTAAVRILGNCFVLMIAMMPAFLFNDYQGLPVTGDYEVETTTDIFVDKSRLENFENDGSYREVPVEFWYPKEAGTQKFPVIFFSHGAFGYRQSNYSTYAELASHGYVVCSMDHPYHSFYTKDSEEKMILVNFDFMREVMELNESSSEEEIYRKSRNWLDLRVADMNFVLDTVIKKSKTEEGVYSLIDTEEIGVMGHSLGGAASVALGRERSDIGAVIDLDGTMLSEETGCIGEKYSYITDPYPVPLLSIDNEEHHYEGEAYASLYVNNVVLQNAIDGRNTWFAGAKHMDFTDLPLFSSVLAKKLGSGEIDHQRCIQTMNHLVLNYFNHYLKDQPELEIKEHY